VRSLSSADHVAASADAKDARRGGDSHHVSSTGCARPSGRSKDRRMFEDDGVEVRLSASWQAVTDATSIHEYKRGNRRTGTLETCDGSSMSRASHTGPSLHTIARAV
jgi:hypothetical protein